MRALRAARARRLPALLAVGALLLAVAPAGAATSRVAPYDGIELTQETLADYVSNPNLNAVSAASDAKAETGALSLSVMAEERFPMEIRCVNDPQTGESMCFQYPGQGTNHEGARKIGLASATAGAWVYATMPVSQEGEVSFSISKLTASVMLTQSGSGIRPFTSAQGSVSIQAHYWYMPCQIEVACDIASTDALTEIVALHDGTALSGATVHLTFARPVPAAGTVKVWVGLEGAVTAKGAPTAGVDPENRQVIQPRSRIEASATGTVTEMIVP